MDVRIPMRELEGIEAQDVLTSELVVRFERIPVFAASLRRVADELQAKYEGTLETWASEVVEVRGASLGGSAEEDPKVP